MKTRTVIVSLSGGVDSAVTAALLLQQGYRVGAVTMKLRGQERQADIEAASSVALYLGIPISIIDLEEVFSREVILPFCERYRLGYTPNPCIECNRRIKFGKLLKITRELGADFMATGHYVRTSLATDRIALLKGTDLGKDQSYFLYTLHQDQLSQVIFPLGGMTKGQVRHLGHKLGLDAFTAKESQDICFIPEGKTAQFVERLAPGSPGDIVDVEGRLVGQHQGLMHFTIGQRRRLGLGGVSREYVVRIDGRRNRVVVGDENDLLSQTVTIDQLTWVSAEPSEATGLTAKLRYRSPEVAVKRLEIFSPCQAIVELCEPQRAVAPGQSIVFYRGDELLGGGIIGAAEAN